MRKLSEFIAANSLLHPTVRALSTTTTALASKHKSQHIGEKMHTKFYEKDFEATSIEELEFVRSPFYDLAALQHVREGPQAEALLTSLTQKLAMTDITTNVTRSPAPNKENQAFSRYADKVLDKRFESVF
jgi:hypothetical protein